MRASSPRTAGVSAHSANTTKVPLAAIMLPGPSHREDPIMTQRKVTWVLPGLGGAIAAVVVLGAAIPASATTTTTYSPNSFGYALAGMNKAEAQVQAALGDEPTLKSEVGGMVKWDAEMSAALKAEGAAEALLRPFLGTPTSTPKAKAPSNRVNLTDLNGVPLTITLDQGWNPAIPATSFDTPDVGTYLVGV